MSTRIKARASFRFALLAAGLCLSGTAYAATTGAANHDGGVTIASAGSQRVVYGHQFRFTGRAAGGSRKVSLEQAPGGQGWRPVAQTTSGGDGSYGFSVRADRSGSYRAVTDSGASSSPENVTVVAKLAGKATRHVRRGATVRVRGRVAPGRGGRKVRLQRKSGRGWKTVARARTGSGGSFRAAWRPSSTGSYRLRVSFGGDNMNAAAGHTLGKRVNVYRPALASWYGPGFYGGHLACGGTMSASKLGVANKSLPCGSKVTLRYHGHTATVPVIDRGPYAGAREYDLTPATKRKLHFGSTGTVWTTR